MSENFPEDGSREDSNMYKVLRRLCVNLCYWYTVNMAGEENSKASLLRTTCTWHMVPRYTIVLRQETQRKG